MSRSKLYAAAIAGLLIFGGLVLFDMIYPGLLPGPLSLSVSLGLAVGGAALIALRPRRRRPRPHEAPPADFTSILEERRRMTEAAEKRPPRLPPT